MLPSIRCLIFRHFARQLPRYADRREARGVLDWLSSSELAAGTHTPHDDDAERTAERRHDYRLDFRYSDAGGSRLRREGRRYIAAIFRALLLFNGTLT